MQSRKLASGSAVVISIALAGCSGSLLESKKIDYKSAAVASKLPSLEIPPDLTAPTADDRYAVPDMNPKGSATFSAYNAERSGQPSAAGGAVVAPTTVAPQSIDKMRVERSGTQRWLVVPGTADKVWPQVRDFWQENGFILNVDRPEIGVMETDWAENRAKIDNGLIRNTIGKVIDGLYSTPERDKFRTRLENGGEAGFVEIYISHRGMMEIYPNEAKDRTIWQPRAADPELEAELLQRLMIRLGADETRAKAQIAAAPQAEKAKLQSASDGAAVLHVQEGFDRAWRRVGLALDRVGFTVEDRDRSQGIYYVRYVDPEADVKKGNEDGLLSKLAFWRSTDAKPVSGGSQYRIYVKGPDATSTVQVLTREGGTDTSASARKILSLLFQQLK
ncbi:MULTISPECIES: outer membrane protein assembly factor BamC [Zoogloea]|jgi:outer membrane protein assembly factor BamC|uniref:Outer membrane protein assembly factor BamC n=1 Tax=Zoogloea oleivorans TaxID=1552750 RepID=A0A6C2D8J3_9RHOO|nr:MULTISPECIES: outer membrane protein assembly factor BamC [Zoogloea]MBT9497141.1 outer membrane protein assembly factor BamC [Zoogloea sp.]MDD2667546.1 outer membrane protein assembly factor BamC [Zoogloea sp.]MDY0035995.1 outer membrane protein assembly factor BamC [Zoogloea oleivorans]TYC62261.1 outer membrane protein assembly factor BamC [Zoogloea oleivorans]